MAMVDVRGTNVVEEAEAFQRRISRARLRQSQSLSSRQIDTNSRNSHTRRHTIASTDVCCPYTESQPTAQLIEPSLR